MTRRALLAALTGAVLDPERLLWRPKRYVQGVTLRGSEVGLTGLRWRIGDTLRVRIPERFLSPILYSGQHAILPPPVPVAILTRFELADVLAGRLPDSMMRRAVERETERAALRRIVGV
jgi:hypothetical protein